MRWVMLAIWLSMAAALGLTVVSIDAATSAAPTATAYPVPSPTVSPTPRSTPVWTAAYWLYLPLINDRPEGAPSAPQVSVAPDPAQGFRLKWAPVDGAVSYLVQEGTDSSMADARDIVRLQPDQPLEIAVPWRAAGVYYYRVSAVNRYGSSASAPLPVTVPSAPALRIEEEAGGGYSVTWPAVVGATNYRLMEATTPSMTGAALVWSGDASGMPMFGPRPRGTYYYRLATTTSQVTVWSLVLAVPLPRPGLWGTVTYLNRPAANVMVELWSCALVGDRCGVKTKLDTATTVSDGTYSFTQVQATDAKTALYVLFDNPRESRDYLNFWRTPNIVGYNGRDTRQLSTFEIGNVFLEEPAPGARVTNPATFRWSPRATRNETYCVMFLDTNRDPLVPCAPVPYGDMARYDMEGVLNYLQTYNWNVWVQGFDGGYGESFYYRQITFVRAGAKGDTDAVRLEAKQGTFLEREAGPPTLEP